MATMECNACKGRYESELADGMRYYHVCPPLYRFTVRRGGAEIRDLPMEARQAGDEEIARVEVARPNARNENVITDDRGVSRIKAEGAGAREVREARP